MCENVPLASLTTLRVGGPARFLYIGDSLDTVKTAHAHARMSGLPLCPIGQGSNILAADEPIHAVLVKMEGTKLTVRDIGEEVELVASAGYGWDALVRECAARNLWGIENLAGIPGTVGAAPVQNIGAYGAEFADTCAWVECYDPEADAVIRIDAVDCRFGYRDSRFKKSPGLVILNVALRLQKQGVPNTSYPDLAKSNELLDTPERIGEAVRRVRSAKFPDLTVCGTAGSFFKNPVVSQDVYARLKETHPELPGFVSPAGVKVPLAWILDHVLALRGFSKGPVRLFEHQPLVLVTETGATAADVEALATEVAARVHAATGLIIEREVQSLA